MEGVVNLEEPKEEVVVVGEETEAEVEAEGGRKVAAEVGVGRGEKGKRIHEIDD